MSDARRRHRARRHRPRSAATWPAPGTACRRALRRRPLLTAGLRRRAAWPTAGIAGTVAVEPTDVLERVKARRLDRSAQFALIAALEAWADAGLDGPQQAGELDGDRLGVAMASGIGGVQTLLTNYDTLLAKGPRRVSPLTVPMLMPNAPAATSASSIGARAGGQHPGLRLRVRQRGDRARPSTMIRLGRADVVVCRRHRGGRSTRCRSPRSPT